MTSNNLSPTASGACQEYISIGEMSPGKENSLRSIHAATENLSRGLRRLDRWKIHKALIPLDPTLIDEISALVKPVFASMNNVEHRVSFLRTLHLVPKHDQILFLKDVQPYLHRITNSHDKCLFVSSTQGLEPDRRHSYLKQGLPFLTPNDSFQHQIDLIDTIKEVETASEKEVLVYAQNLINVELDLKDRITLIERIRVIPPKLRKKFCQKASFLNQAVKLCHRSELIKTILSDDPLVMYDKLCMVLQLHQATPRMGEKEKLFLKLLTSPAANLPALDSIYRFIIGSLDPVHLSFSLFKLFFYLEKKDLEELASWISRLAPDTRSTKLDCIRYFRYVSIRPREGIRYLLSRAPNLPLRELHADFLLYHLQEHETDPDEAIEIANYIVENYENLGIHDESYLFSKAIEVILIQDQDTKNPLNPYKIYRKHLDKASNPKPITPIAISYEDRILLFDPMEGLKRASQMFAPVCTLPSDFDFRFFRLSADLLDQKIIQMGCSVRHEVLTKIEMRTGFSFVHLKENLQDPFFDTSLFSLSKKPDEIPIHALKLGQITGWLNSLSRVDETELHLTEFETALLDISVCISNCPEGKKLGIQRAYRLLPEHLRLFDGAVDDSDGIRRLLDTTFFSFLEKELDSQAWIKDLLKPKVYHKIAELPHHVLFVKNKIARLLGIRHRILFDSYTGVLIPHIVRFSQQKMLARFLSRLDIDQILTLIQDAYQQLPERSRRGIFNQLNEKFHGKSLEILWDADNDFSMTKEGALQILFSSGFFN
jgi:hypothetical protein